MKHFMSAFSKRRLNYMVSIVSARWLTGLGFRHTWQARYLAGTISWNACELIIIRRFNYQMLQNRHCLQLSSALYRPSV